MFKIGDLVTRKSYNNDVVFKIIDIKDDVYYLKGVNVRLCADSDYDDLVGYTEEAEEDNDDFFLNTNKYQSLDRSEYFYLPGKVLHIDSDRDYLDKCLKFYKKNKAKAYGIYEEENKVSANILNYLELYNPDILVITGHDAYYRKRKDRDKYKNSTNFINSVKEARKYEKSHEKLIIIAGACQSDYEELIKAGANFASSPKRINIHALDPAIIATAVSFSDRTKDIDLINILNQTKYGSEGMGGIITPGTMYVGYPRE